MRQQRKRYKRLALFMFSLFLILAVYGAYSVLSYGNRWFASSRNPRVRTQKENVVAGDILDRNGIMLATTGKDGTRVYQADVRDRSAVVHVLGDPQGQVANGVETFQTGYLYGFQTSLDEMEVNLFQGRQRKGDTVQLTIDAQLSRVICDAFSAAEKTKDRNGAAVVMNYETGEVLSIVSLPGFDPENITSETQADPGKPFWNRATQSVYPPGSTFKVVTTASALQNLTEAEHLVYLCTGELGVDDHAIHDFGLAHHGEIALERAFTVSCNNVYAQVALEVGDSGLRKTAEGFGFNENFLFRDLVVENSSYPQTRDRTPYEVAASGFGQSAIVATPMHMCMVAGAVANRGVMMEPILLRHVESPLGRERMNMKARTYRQALKMGDAEILDRFMQNVVEHGTGSRAAVSGQTVCGKTGTADSTLDGEAVSYGWFIGYMKGDIPICVSVLVEDIADGDGGGNTAAVIAGEIFRYAVKHPGRILGNQE